MTAIMAESAVRSYCVESQKLLREATTEFGARSYCVESQKLLREATPEFGARSYCVESQKLLREATPEFGARSYCVESQKLLHEATPEFGARSYCVESQKRLREATPEFGARSYCVESQKLLREGTPEFGARSYCVESQKRLREATPEFGARSYCTESQKLLREAKPVKRRLSSILGAAVVATGSCVLITLHIFVTLSSLDVDAPPHSFTTNKDILEEHALKFRSMGHVKEKRSELANLDPHSAQKQHFKEFVMEYFLERAEKFHQTRVDCASLLAGDQKSIKRAVGISKVLAGLERIKHGESGRVAKLKGREAIPPSPKLIKEEVRKWPPWEFQRLTNLWYIKATLDCMTFKQTRGYILSPLTPEEEEFPIAFSLIVYKDIEMVERILRSVYRPQNSYCIHVDLKADPQFYAAAEAVAGCFRENVRMSSRRVAVKWGTYTTLEPELICMRDLLDMDSSQGSPRDVKRRKKPEWKYFINLTGQDFPLKTNFELVKILTAFGGANNEEGTLENANRERWTSEPPHGITAVKGAVHTVVNRATVDFIVTSPIAIDFLKWLRDTEIPDETLFASINYNPQLGIPGTYNGSGMESVKAFARFKKWNVDPSYTGCPSQLVVNDICILSTGDLEDLGQSPHLFANKFFLDQDRIVLACLEEKLFNATRDESLGTRTFDTTLYSQQDFVLNQVRAAS